MASRVERSCELHDCGYNCAQSVLCTFADLLDEDEELLFRISEGLGLGMGGTYGTCGALSGACLLAGLVGSDGNLEGPASKHRTYDVSRRITERFREETGSTTCRELKGIETGRPLATCSRCIEVATAIAEEELFS